MAIKFLKENGDDFEVGDTIRVETTVESNEPFESTKNLTDPSVIRITITGYNDNQVVSQEDMSKHATGQYFFNWDTSGLSAGDYNVKINVSDSNASETENEWIKLK